MSDDSRLYRFVSNLLNVVDRATPPELLYARIHDQFRAALPPNSVDAFVFILHEPVLNLVNFAYFKAPDGYACPANRPLATSGGLSDWVILNKQSRLWYFDDRDADLTPPRNPVQARYAVPLMLEDRVFGAMMIESYAPGFRYQRASLDFIDHAIRELSRVYRLYECLRTGSFFMNNPGFPFLVCRIQDSCVIEVNHRAAETLGYAMEEMLGKPFPVFFAEDDRALLLDRYQRRMDGREDTTHYFTRLRRKDGTEIPVETFIALGDFFNGRPAVIATCVDVTEVQRVQREAEATRARLLRFRREDRLTGLLNQATFFEEAQRSVSRLGGDGDENSCRMALIVIDLDNFKAINWFHGIAAGDILLCQVADRMRSNIRQSDLLARIDSNRFALLLYPSGGKEMIGAYLQRLISRIARPFDLDGKTVSITASAGVSLFPQHGVSVEELDKNAEAALLVAKKLHNRFAFVDDGIIQEFVFGVSYQEELKVALQRGEFVAWYQPKCDRFGRIVGAEALARWQSPNRGMVLPNRFISTLERIGLIGELGRQIFDQASAFTQKIQENGNHGFCVAVNTAPSQLDEGDFFAYLAGATERFGILPGAMELEITESVIMNAESFNFAALDFLDKVRSICLRISLDDFGTGTSSLSRLRSLAKHVDKIKIDKSLVDQIGDDGGDIYFKAILNLARSLDTPEKKIVFVIEGVETQSQADFLLSDEFQDIELEFQGYFFARPMPEDEFLALLDIAPADSIPAQQEGVSGLNHH